MEYHNNPWKSLTFRAGDAASDAAYKAREFHKRLDRQYNKNDKLEFVSPSAYKSALAFWARREVVAAASNAIKQILPSIMKEREKARLKAVREQQSKISKRIIQDGNAVEETWGLGEVDLVDDHNLKIRARDALGNTIKESLMLYYDADEKYSLTEKIVDPVSGEETETTTSTYRVVFTDLSPRISVSSGKNIVMTEVQGRDFTRKELVSGGDLTFHISGQIVSNYATMETENGRQIPKVYYPDKDVRRFIQIMQHPGIIYVNHYLFKQFNVSRVIVKDFNLERQEFKNIQPYSFTCVAVEPDEDVIIKQDTINILNAQLQVKEKQGWLDYVLAKKLDSIVKVRDRNISFGIEELPFFK